MSYLHDMSDTNLELLRVYRLFLFYPIKHPYLLKHSNIFTFVYFFTILKNDEFKEPGCKDIESSPEGNLIKHS